MSNFGQKKTYDAIVIGGGVLGAATAYELAEAGLTAAVLERSRPGRQGSGTTAGNLHIQAVHSRRPGQELPLDNGRLLPLQKKSYELWGQLESRLGEDIGLVQSGGFTVAESEEDLLELRRKFVLEQDIGIPTEVLTQAEVREAMPLMGESVIGATWCEWDGYANALLTIPAYLRAAQRRGVHIFTHAPALSVERQHGGWVVETPIGAFSGGVVINVAGPWIDEVSRDSGLDLAMAPTAIQMIETPRAPRTMDVLVQHISKGLSVKQVNNGNIVIGGGWPAEQLNLGGYTGVKQESVVGNWSDATRVLPFVDNYAISRAWAGPLAATPDEMPVIGEIDGFEGYYVAGGTYAFTFSPLWAKVLVELILDKTPLVEVADLTPNRLIQTSLA